MEFSLDDIKDFTDVELDNNFMNTHIIETTFLGSVIGFIMRIKLLVSSCCEIACIFKSWAVVSEEGWWNGFLWLVVSWTIISMLNYIIYKLFCTLPGWVIKEASPDEAKFQRSIAIKRKERTIKAERFLLYYSIFLIIIWFVGSILAVKG